MKFSKSELSNIIKEEISSLLDEVDQEANPAKPEVATQSVAAKRAQKLMDILIERRPKIFQALEKDPIGANQFVSYIANRLNVDLTKTTAQSAIKTQAQRIGIGKDPSPASEE
tara:strand:+ start:1048 stop:1386 length:339 start_codon:yes stop_codon:yes gene_type:complete